jgi:hypothetical protein
MSESQQTPKHDLVYKIIISVVFLLIGILIGYALRGSLI